MYCIVLNIRLSLFPDERSCPERMNEVKVRNCLGGSIQMQLERYNKFV